MGNHGDLDQILKKQEFETYFKKQTFQGSTLTKKTGRHKRFQGTDSNFITWVIE